MERGTGLGASSSTSSVFFFCCSFLFYQGQVGGDGGAPKRVLGGRDDSFGDVFLAKDIAVGAARQTEVVYRRGGDPGNGASVELPELLSLRRGEEQSEAKLRFSRIWRVGCESSFDIKGGGSITHSTVRQLIVCYRLPHLI